MEKKMTKRKKKYNSGESKVIVDPTVSTPKQAMARALRGEYVPSGYRTPLPAGDYSDYPTDLAASMTIVKNAKERFDALPAVVRQHFGNSPAALAAAISEAQINPQKYTELVNIGLLKPPKKEASPPPNELKTTAPPPEPQK